MQKNDDKNEELSNVFPNPPATCLQCLGILNPDEVIVQAERGGNFALWHAKCFVCESCKELLVDLMYFFHKGKVYCGRHYADIMKIPRCYACDEVRFQNVLLLLLLLLPLYCFLNYEIFLFSLFSLKNILVLKENHTTYVTFAVFNVMNLWLENNTFLKIINRFV